jgi:thioesterase domain-containing protein
MVDDYLEQILTIQTEGPFFLLGYCFGGLVVQAMAAELQNCGNDVAFLGMISPDFPSCNEPEVLPSENYEYALRLLGMLVDKDAESLISSDPYYGLIIERAAENLENVNRIMQNFVPPIYKGDSTMFIPTDRTPSMGQIIDEWSPHLEGEIFVHDIEGTHDEMLLPKSMAAIGEILDRSLS